MCAIIDKTLSSNVGFKGIFRKVLIFVMVGIALLIISVILLERGSSQKTCETDGSDGANV